MANDREICEFPHCSFVQQVFCHSSFAPVWMTIFCLSQQDRFVQALMGPDTELCIAMGTR